MNKQSVETFRKVTKLTPATICDTYYSIVAQLLRQEVFQMEQLLSPIFEPEILNTVSSFYSFIIFPSELLFN